MPSTQSIPAVTPLCDVDQRIAAIHADLHACRLALLASLSRDPADTLGREPMWMELHRLKRDARNTLARIADAVVALDSPDEDGRHVVKLPVQRADGSHALVSTARLFPYLGEIAPGWLPGDAESGVPMPADERARLSELSS